MKKSNSLRRLWTIIAVFIVILTLIFLYSMLSMTENQQQKDTEFTGACILDLNEIEQLYQNENSESSGSVKASEKVDELQSKIQNYNHDAVEKNQKLFITLYVGSVICILVIGAYLHFIILRPFTKMESFAHEIAKGNFDTQLNYERHQFFGAFTWAFDSMRREIIKARSCEKEAIENNKTVIATLSHDIKTPISSIRAYAEAMESNMDTSMERRARYLKVIMRKCDEVTDLTNDLFLHSISDLNKLVIVKEKVQVRPLLESILNELKNDSHDIKIQGVIKSVELQLDQKRFTQVIENIVGNARKYAADSPITIWTEIGESYEIHIRDQGNGISEEDMPFIFEKFYRGKEVSKYPGAGLGLYIVKYVMNQLSGDVVLKNEHPGLEVILSFPLDEKSI